MIRFFFRLVFFLSALIISVKTIPPYIENSKLTYLFKSVAGNPELRNASDKMLLEAVKQGLEMDNIKVLTSEQINIDHDNDGIKLSAEYSVKIKVLANISLLLEFQPSSNN